MEKTQEQAISFVEWYKDLLENHKERVFAYLAPTVFVDWFGRTCKGCKEVSKLLNGLSEVKHIVENIEPRKQLTHRGHKRIQPCLPHTRKDQGDYEIDYPTHIDMELYDVPPMAANNGVTISVTAGDGQVAAPPDEEAFHTPEKSSVVVEVPMELGGGDGARVTMKYVVVTGYLDMRHGAGSSKANDEAHKQFLKLKIAYSEDSLSNEYMIWYVIYESKNKCRRNLLSQFQNVLQ